MSDWLTILLILTPVLGMFSGLLYFLRQRQQARYVSAPPPLKPALPKRASQPQSKLSKDAETAADALEIAGDVLQVVGVALEVASVFTGEGGGFGGGGASGSW